MGLSEQMLRMSGIGGLQLGPIRWQGKANGKSVPPVDTPLPLQQVSILSHNNTNCNSSNHKNSSNNNIWSGLLCSCRINFSTQIHDQHHELGHQYSLSQKWQTLALTRMSQHVLVAVSSFCGLAIAKFVPYVPILLHNDARPDFGRNSMQLM